MIDKETLKNDLKEWIMTVTFTKKDGTKRLMKCTLIKHLLPKVEEMKGKAENPDVLAVWDLDNEGWRSFRLDSIESISYDRVSTEEGVE